MKSIKEFFEEDLEKERSWVITVYVERSGSINKKFKFLFPSELLIVFKSILNTEGILKFKAPKSKNYRESHNYDFHAPSILRDALIAKGISFMTRKKVEERFVFNLKFIELESKSSSTQNVENDFLLVPMLLPVKVN